MSREFGFVTVDATRSEAEIQARIRRRVQSLLERRRVTTLTESLAALRPLLFEPGPATRKAVKGAPPPERQSADGSPEGELP
jgi:hypothetical protein